MKRREYWCLVGDNGNVSWEAAPARVTGKKILIAVDAQYGWQPDEPTLTPLNNAQIEAAYARVIKSIDSREIPAAF